MALHVAGHYHHEHTPHGHHHHHHDDDDDYGCRSDNDCEYNEECFLELNTEKYTGECRVPIANLDLLLLHCKSTIDCPPNFECVSTFDKSRGMCEKMELIDIYDQHREIKVEDDIALGDGSGFEMSTTQNVKKRRLNSQQYVSIAKEDADMIGNLDHLQEQLRNANDNNDHCGLPNIPRVILDDEPPVVNEEENDFLSAVDPTKKKGNLRTSRKLNEKDLATCSMERMPLRGSWEDDCKDPKVRDSFIDKKVKKKSIEVVHAVFLNSKKEWPSKSVTEYDPLTPRDLEYQTKELNRYYNGTGLHFTAKIKTVVDDDMYYSYLLSGSTSASAIQSNLIKEGGVYIVSQLMKLAGGIYPLNELNYVRKGAKVFVKFRNLRNLKDKTSRLGMTGSVEYQLVVCPQLDDNCIVSYPLNEDTGETTRTYSKTWIEEMKGGKTLNQKIDFLQSIGKDIIITAPESGYLYLVVKSSIPELVFQGAVKSTDQYVKLWGTALKRFNYESNGKHAIFVMWKQLRHGPKPGQLYALNGFAGDMPGSNNNLPGDMGGIVVVDTKRAYIGPKLGIGHPSKGANASISSTTLAHELGHVFGLHHTFNQEENMNLKAGFKHLECLCAEHAGQKKSFLDTVGDQISDTPAHRKYSDRCYTPEGTEHCGAKYPGGFKMDNLMSYSTCREYFTPQQIGRMKCFLHNNRQLNAISGGVEGVASKFESKESGNNSGVNGKDNNNRNIKINPLVFLIGGVGVVFGLALVSFLFIRQRCQEKNKNNSTTTIGQDSASHYQSLQPSRSGLGTSVVIRA